MMREIGYCHGIENYSRHFSGRLPGEPPPTLLDYLPQDSVMFMDESHQTVPQVRGMYHGDRSRKEVLVCARLPACRVRSTTVRLPLRNSNIGSIK